MSPPGSWRTFRPCSVTRSRSRCSGRRRPGSFPTSEPLSVATATLLRQLAGERPVIVAIDDVQWLDDATISILAYAVRRLVDRPVGLLLAARGALDHRTRELLNGVPPDRRDRLLLGPLPLAALHQLFLARFGRSFPRMTLVRIEEASLGNPFYALEIARALGDAGIELPPDGRVPIPDSLGSLLEVRLAALPEATRSALLLAAVAIEPTIDGLRRADPHAPEALRPAFEAGVATMDRHAVRFTHPLLGQAVLEGAERDAVRSAHAALARAASSSETRARHLAGATEGRDPAVAAALEAAAGASRDRGATLDAAALYGRASELTPQSDASAIVRRARLAAETLFIDVSDYVQADRILDMAIAQAPPGPERAEALSLLALIRYYHGRTPEAVRLGQQAVDEAGDDEILRGHGHRTSCLPRDAGRPRTRQCDGQRRPGRARSRRRSLAASTQTCGPTCCSFTHPRSSGSCAAIPPRKPSKEPH